MTKKELLEFFKLTKNKKLFDLAIKPDSYGGNEEFKFMALLGDSLLKMCLTEILAEKFATKNTGELTKLGVKFHNKKTLVKLSKHLNISDLMNPTKKNIRYHRMMLEKLLKHSFMQLMRPIT
ncbi:MAG: hypothetical protein KGD59_06740 [Candidatus Heimdallarchaeota archaeon]|nr:hypothetical protein [Candidatus Heimdallarchaeota archaeon]MBY8994231.1 hypothetical protein [Candidatus Heimdallarchaeota archaeon]